MGFRLRNRFFADVRAAGWRILIVENKAKKAVRFENPLMPDERLRQMYTAMVQMRMLEECLAKRRRPLRGANAGKTIRGEEAARASTALSLGSGDLLSDCCESPGMDLLLGSSLDELRSKKGAAVRNTAAKAVREGYALRLAPTEDSAEQLQIALGAAAALKAQRNGRVLLVYTRVGEAKSKRWEKTLRVAGSRELPVIFVVLPRLGEGHSRFTGELSRRSRQCGVPGFPVDGSDAIALYRVTQESLLRGRVDGGPALVECIPFHVKGKARARPEDPIERLRELLLAKGVASDAWMSRTGSTFSRRLGYGRA